MKINKQSGIAQKKIIHFAWDPQWKRKNIPCVYGTLKGKSSTSKEDDFPLLRFMGPINRGSIKYHWFSIWEVNVAKRAGRVGSGRVNWVYVSNGSQFKAGHF